MQNTRATLSKRVFHYKVEIRLKASNLDSCEGDKTIGSGCSASKSAVFVTIELDDRKDCLATKGFAILTRARYLHMLMLKGSRFSPRLVIKGGRQDDGSWRWKLNYIRTLVWV